MMFSKQLGAMAQAMKINFTLYGKPIAYEEVFSDVGLLPAITRRADQLCSLCLGYGIGATFTDVDKSLLGVKVQFDEVTPNLLRLFCMCDVVSELVRVAPTKNQIPVDELMYD